jgi:hypothetical protein
MFVLRALFFIPAVVVFAPLAPNYGDANGDASTAVIETFREATLSELMRVKAELADHAREPGTADN